MFFLTLVELLFIFCVYLNLRFSYRINLYLSYSYNCILNLLHYLSISIEFTLLFYCSYIFILINCSYYRQCYSCYLVCLCVFFYCCKMISFCYNYSLSSSTKFEIIECLFVTWLRVIRLLLFIVGVLYEFWYGL